MLLINNLIYLERGFFKKTIMVNFCSDIKFITFLQNELCLSAGDIAMALKKHESSKGPFAMLLWQYGLVNIEQLERLLDWLDEHHYIN